MTDAHITPELILSGLRLLVEGYKLARDRFKDKKTPDRVEEVIIEAEQAKPETVDASEIERRVAEALDPSDAAIVKGDMELLSLLLLPAPKLEAFDYWSMLDRLVGGLRVYAEEKRLFELRGKKFSFGQGLLLCRTGPCILPSELAGEFAVPHRMQALKDAEAIAFLQKDARNFPIIVAVKANFYQYSSIGGTPGVESDSCFYDVMPGQQRHWLKFDRGQRYSAHFGQASEYMLSASDFASICAALRDDIQEYAAEIQADQQKIGPLFAAIDAFAKGIPRK